MPSYAGTLSKLRQIADDGDTAVSSGYSKAAAKSIFPKPKGGENGLHERILNQIESEYQESYAALKYKISKYLSRLKLYNNQMRDDSAVGDPHIFVNHQTVLAALYYDRLQVEFEPREEGDEDVADNMNTLSEFDYDEMWKPWNDYQWDWDAGFYGWSLKWFYDFDRKSKTPLQQIWDPAAFLHDPRAKSVNGDRLGGGAMRFGGREVYLTRREMESNPEYFNLDLLEQSGGNAGGTSVVARLDQARRQAQGITAGAEQVEGVNEQYAILQWLTHIQIGGVVQKCLVETANGRSLVIRITPLDDYWPLIKRDLYPMANSWDGVSVCDLTEDKQRFRAMLINTIGKAARADVEPMYLFDSNKVTQNTDFKFGFNKFIPINGPVGENVILPLRKAQPGSIASYILDFLDLSSQKALATPDIRQGVPSQEKRTLGETQLMSAGVSTRYSLTARVFGWSEKQEWSMWYKNYERNFESRIDEKAIRLSGVFGPQWRKLTRENIVASSALGLDIKIESRELSTAKKRELYVQMGGYLASVLTDPSADRTYALRMWGKQLLTRQEVERILPLTQDERLAKKENESLNDKKSVEVRVEDNHDVHLRVHAAAKDNPATQAHIKAHEEALIAKRIAPQIFPMMPGEQTGAPTALASSGPAMMNKLGNNQPAELTPGGMGTMK